MHKQFAFGLEPPQTLLFIAQAISPSCVKLAQFIEHSIKVHHSRSTDFLQRKFSEKLSQIFKYTKTIGQKLACGRRFERKQWAFKCYTCLYQKSGIFCIECFNKGNHEGHNYEKVFDNGGYCDCGDSEMIKQQGHCTQHQLVLSSIQIDKIQTQLFIKQMQFVFYLLSVLENKNQLSNSMSFLIAMSNSLIKFLIGFNQNSLTSNLMTIELLKSKMYLEATFIQFDIQTIYEYIFRFDYLKQYSQLINNLYIPLNLIYEFKILKIQQRIKGVKKNCRILISPINKHIQNLFRMQRVMSGVFESSSNSLPYEILQISTDLSLKKKLKIFQKYYNDLRMIANLKEGLNYKYIKHHFINGDITNLSVYENWVWENYQDFVDKNYVIQLNYLLLITQFIQEVKSDKQVLIKLMKELIAYQKMHKEKNKYVSLFNPKSRTLLLLIHAYFEGNISQAANQDFLELISMTGQILHRIMQSILNTIRFNALILTNVSVGDRYVSYMQSVLGPSSRLISSIDMELAKFCMLSMQFFFPQKQQHAELKLHYEKLTQYQQTKIMVQPLIQMPLHNAKQFLNSKRQSDKHIAFDRQKSFNYLSNYINFLRNILVVQHHNFTINSYLDIRSQQQITNLCGSFVKRFESINFELFKQICSVLFNSQKNAQLDFFVNTFADIENKKIKLKQEYKNKFQPICLSFLKMNRYCQWFQVLISGYQVNMIQMVKQKSSQINSHQQSSFIFTQKFLSQLINIAKQYSILLQNSTKVFHEDFGTYENFIIELLGVYFITYCIQIQIFLISLQQFEKIFNNLSKPLKQQIGKLFLNATYKQKQEQNSIEQSKQKMKQLKQKKLQKFKKKQIEVSEKLMKQIPAQIQNEQSQNYKCIVCSLDKKGEGLLLLCHVEQSTLFSTLYLKKTELIYSFTSCQHLVHASCIKFLVCQYCKFEANCGVNLSDRNQEEARQESEEKTNLNGKSDIFDNIQFIFEVNTHRSEIYVKLARSLASSILYAVIVDYNLFLTHQLLISCAILQDLMRKKILFEQEIMSLLESGSSIGKQHLVYQSAYQYLLERIFQTKGSQERLTIIKSQIPQQLLFSIEAIFSYILKSIKHTQISAPHIQTNSLPVLLELPQSIAELSTHIGLCPNCSQHTNQIALCVICKFRTCLGCKGVNLTYHMLKQHGDSCIYIRADNGMPLYLGKSGEGDQRKVNMKQYLNSVYVNSKGEFYTAKLDFDRRSEFYLDNQAYNAVKMDLIRQRICQIHVAGGIRKSNKQVEYKQP